MLQTNSRDFGALEFDPTSVIEFPAGLAGFEDQTRFVLIERPGLQPVVVLQSLDSMRCCFLAVPVAVIDPAYQIAVTLEDLRLLGLDPHRQPRPGEEVLCLALLAASESGPSSANLLAPIVINLATRHAAQAVRADSRYSHCHPLTPREAPCS